MGLRLRFIYILFAISFAEVKNVERMFLSVWYVTQIVNEHILMVITHAGFYTSEFWSDTVSLCGWDAQAHAGDQFRARLGGAGRTSHSQPRSKPFWREGPGCMFVELL